MNNQIVPSEWVRVSTQRHSITFDGGYGYMWWTFLENGRLGKLGTYAAFGYGGHAIYVVPEAKLVFVHRADTYGGRRRHVNNVAIQNILLEVLKARAGPQLPTPKLIAVDSSPSRDPDKVLSKAQALGLSGSYSNAGHVVTLRELDGRLEATSPRWGSYFLIPRTATVFEAEDAQTRVEFVPDATGIATAIRIWFDADEPLEMSRVQ